MARAISERTVEVPWVLDTIKTIGPDAILDVGFAGGWYLQQILDMGIKCTGLDADVNRISGEALLIGGNEKAKWVKLAQQITPMIKDITKYPVVDESHPTFPVVICVSTIEHIVTCGYKNDCYRDLESDIRAVTNMKKLVSVGGELMLTFPCGQEQFFYNQSRKRAQFFHPQMFTAGKYDIVVYGQERLSLIIGEWQVTDQQFWTRQNGEADRFTKCVANAAFSKTSSIEIPVQSVCAIRMISP